MTTAPQWPLGGFPLPDPVLLRRIGLGGLEHCDSVGGPRFLGRSESLNGQRTDSIGLEFAQRRLGMKLVVV